MPRKQTATSKEPGYNLGGGSVTNAPEGAEPSGFYWDRLKEARGDKAKLDKLLDELEIHGYGRDGQLYTAALAAYNDTGATKRRSPRKRAAAKRAAATPAEEE